VAWFAAHCGRRQDKAKKARFNALCIRHLGIGVNEAGVGMELAVKAPV